MLKLQMKFEEKKRRDAPVLKRGKKGEARCSWQAATVGDGQVRFQVLYGDLGFKFRWRTETFVLENYILDGKLSPGKLL